ncbi:zinc-ribbon domain-containing protein [Oceaniglobus roseus]|uniref:zinc-ribbon domain-containing protein n=1 Tax=Oceaniglobus roseus TaxID=1737570 RepID=UPI0012FFFC45|nr:zinc-ribbon domain-containing protein [Kandeliimicrobium roseum]
MRLTCPNCAAQYEVDASMIPAEGRDVQCSACGHTWFQAAEAAKDSVAETPAASPDDFDDYEEDEPLAPATAAAEATRPMPQQPPGAASHRGEAADTAGDDAAPRPRPLDEAARAVLREEALREAEARRRESSVTVETQPDLGLSGGGVRSRPARAVEDETTEPTEDPEAAPATPAEQTASSRRELLPDIEEINSTLTATSDRQQAGPEHDDSETEDLERRSGFRIGFFAVLGVFVVLTLLYVFGPRLAQAVPAAAPTINGYLLWASGVLDSVDSGLNGTIDSLNALLNGSDGQS